MKTIGIEINNNRAIFYALESSEGIVDNITNNFKQITLSDDKDNAEIRSLQSIIFSHFDTINPDRIAILTRQGKGPYSSSSISFKIEALIQCYSSKGIEFVSPQALTAFYKKNEFNLSISHNYQEKAARLSNLLLTQ